MKTPPDQDRALEAFRLMYNGDLSEYHPFSVEWSKYLDHLNRHESEFDNSDLIFQAIIYGMEIARQKSDEYLIYLLDRDYHLNLIGFVDDYGGVGRLFDLIKKLRSGVLRPKHDLSAILILIQVMLKKSRMVDYDQVSKAINDPI
jgi:hypothetical protein